MENKPRATLEIPEGAVFELEADGLVIGSRDDVVIRGNIGHRLKKVFSENGSIELRSPTELVVETVETKKGKIIIAGAVRAKSLKATTISLLEGTLTARSLSAEKSIELTAGRIEADLVMSPQVTVSAEVRGRATVIESQNELGPHQLKGGFKMAEFLEMMPSAQKVIQSEASHIPQLAGLPRTPMTTAAATGVPPGNGASASQGGQAAADGGNTWAGTAREVESAVEEEAASGGAPQEAVEEATAAGATEADNWFGEADGSETEATQVGAEESMSEAATSDGSEEAPAEDAPAEETYAEEAPAAEIERPPFHDALAEMCSQVCGVYQGQNLAVPPPVQRLTDLVGAGEYAQVKSQLTTTWNQLIQYHKESKLPFAVKTTQMFQSIQRTLAQHV